MVKTVKEFIYIYKWFSVEKWYEDYEQVINGINLGIKRRCILTDGIICGIFDVICLLRKNKQYNLSDNLVAKLLESTKNYKKFSGPNFTKVGNEEDTWLMIEFKKDSNVVRGKNEELFYENNL